MNVTDISAATALPMMGAETSPTGLTVALVIFIMLTVLLAAFVIMLFVWKRFRDFFFDDSQKEKRRAQSKSRTNARRNAKTAKRTSASNRSAARKQPESHNDYSHNAFDYYDGGVPTVPLDGSSESVHETPDRHARAKHSEETLEKIPTVVIPTPITHERAGVQVELPKSGERRSASSADEADAQKPAVRHAASQTQSGNRQSGASSRRAAVRTEQKRSAADAETPTKKSAGTSRRNSKSTRMTSGEK